MTGIEEKRQAYFRNRLNRQANRPGQAAADGRYWIVLNLSVQKNLRLMPPGLPYRHPTLEAAVAHAEKLSAEPDKIGWRFGVFEFTTVTRKVEPRTPTEATASETERAAA